jgi:hypothetical protein
MHELKRVLIALPTWQKGMETILTYAIYTILTYAIYISTVPEQELVMEWIKAGAPHKVRMSG